MLLPDEKKAPLPPPIEQDKPHFVLEVQDSSQGQSTKVEKETKDGKTSS